MPVSSGGAVSGDSGSLETMSVVESLVKLGEKQPTETENGSTEETPEVFISLPLKLIFYLRSFETWHSHVDINSSRIAKISSLIVV